MDEPTNRAQELARDVLHLARNTLLVNLRFLDAALSRLTLYRHDTLEFGTEGEHLVYTPSHILRTYKSEREALVRNYLHLVLHCVFRHMFIHSLVNQPAWDLACDIAVEHTITGLGLRSAECARERTQAGILADLEKKVGMLTAERIYSYFLDKRVPPIKLAELRGAFYADDHSLWYLPPEQQKGVLGMTDTYKVEPNGNSRGDGTGNGEEQSDGDGQSNGNRPGNGYDLGNENGTGDGEEQSNGDGQSNGNRPGNGYDLGNRNGTGDGEKQSDGDGQSGGNDPGNGNGAGSGNSPDGILTRSIKRDATAIRALEEDWKGVSERMQLEMETFARRQQGHGAGSLIQNLKEVNRERYDYTAFLKKFAVMGEAMKINDEEFDYVFYTYGLRLYENLPLIEPLEYKEVKRIREFVIAIDTSGSVAGELVQAFLQKTYNILQSTESFFSKINLHVIQCDAEIQDHVKITRREEFDDYLKTMKIRGLGGTDFRPVFSLVDELVLQHEFTNLKGMIYFTDGYGTFPAQKPGYDTAFVFLEDEEYGNPEVPPWAIKLVLRRDDIR